eukprot:809474-Prymnesium_polylepis.1
MLMGTALTTHNTRAVGERGSPPKTSRGAAALRPGACVEDVPPPLLSRQYRPSPHDPCSYSRLEKLVYITKSTQDYSRRRRGWDGM